MPVQDRMTPRNLYLYLVCLIMLLVSLFAVVQLVRNAIGIAYPEDVASYGWSAYEDPSVIGGGVDEEVLSAEQDAAKDSQRRSEIIGTVTAGLTLLLAGGLFVVHWRRAQAERSLPAAAALEVPAAPPAG